MNMANIASTSLRYRVSSAVVCAIFSYFLMVLISDGHLSLDLDYLTSVPNDIAGERKAVMADLKEKDHNNQMTQKI